MAVSFYYEENGMVAILGNRSYFTVKSWVADFKRGRESPGGDQRSGPHKLRHWTTCIRLRKMNGRCVTVQHIADIVGIISGFDRHTED